MRRWLQTALAVAIATLALVAPAREAGACSCIVNELAAQVQAASLVFLGRVDASHETGTATFTVDRVFKGSATGRVTVSAGSPDDSCAVPLVERRRYVVFATPGQGGLVTGVCSGTTDDLSVAARLSVGVPSSPGARPNVLRVVVVSSRSIPIAAAAILIAAVAAASLFAIRFQRRPRPIA